MTININALDITGVEELYIRDNVVEPDSSLVQRALTELLRPYKAASLNRAKQAYQQAYQQGDLDGLPNFLNEEAVLNWYFNSDYYVSASDRQYSIDLDKAKKDLQAKKSHRLMIMANIETATEALLPTYQTQLTNITAEISDLEDTVSDLETKLGV